MKKSRNNGKKWILIAVIICLVFAAGIGAGTYISGKIGKSSQSTQTKDSAQSDGNKVKDHVVKKEDAEDTAGDGKKDSTDSKDNTDASDEDEKTDSSQNTSSNEQSADQGSTYDASIPDDDTAIHRYEYILSDCTWQEAFEDCLNRGGYLARINSSKEYEAIRKEISKQKMTNIYFRLGGRRDGQSQEYYWVNEDNKLFGEKLNSDSSWCSDEWMENEPSFQDGNLEEKYMDLFFFDGEKRFVWNDVPDDMLAAEPAYSGKLGYICEYED